VSRSASTTSLRVQRWEENADSGHPSFTAEHDTPAVPLGISHLAEQQLGDAARLGDQVGLLKLRNRALRRALLDAAFSGRLTGRTTDMEIVEEMAGV
jgi:hypothetical protein